MRYGRHFVKVLAALGTTAALMVGALAVTSPSAGAESARKVSAWLPYWDSRAYQSFLDNSDLYSELSPFWYELSASGSITPYPGAEDATIVNGAKNKGVAVIPTITNDFDPARVHTMLATAASRAAHVTAIVNLVVTKDYDGFDVDYESLQASERDLFSAFVSELATALHAKGKKLTVAVHPKTSEPGSWDGPQAQDYAAIGKAADKVRIMAYDYHWSTSAAGAIAPLSWVEQVAQFSVSQISAAKVQLGMPSYGYDWVGSTGEGQMWAELEALRANKAATKQWSTADTAPWFTYSADGKSHTVWYENAQSIDPKLALVDKYGLAGAIFWRIGGEDPAVWTKARTRWGTQTAPATTTTTLLADKIAPTAPSSVSGVTGAASASLKWTGSTDAGGSGVSRYYVYRATSSGGTYAKVGGTTSTSFVNTGLTPGATYWYYVRARDTAGNMSGLSNKISVRAS
ncbi:MAG TPA: glycosyl hydrolase family 18 protein [Acidimicrobiales bacterium]|nr:glycosyl hydrolase family 18 protein [Acidimicrobiales bacterium]